MKSQRHKEGPDGYVRCMLGVLGVFYEKSSFVNSEQSFSWTR